MKKKDLCKKIDSVMPGHPVVKGCIQFVKAHLSDCGQYSKPLPRRSTLPIPSKLEYLKEKLLYQKDWADLGVQPPETYEDYVAWVQARNSAEPNFHDFDFLPEDLPPRASAWSGDNDVAMVGISHNQSYLLPMGHLASSGAMAYPLPGGDLMQFWTFRYADWETDDFWFGLAIIIEINLLAATMRRKTSPDKQEIACQVDAFLRRDPVAIPTIFSVSQSYPIMREILPMILARKPEITQVFEELANESFKQSSHFLEAVMQLASKVIKSLPVTIDKNTRGFVEHAILYGIWANYLNVADYTRTAIMYGAKVVVPATNG